MSCEFRKKHWGTINKSTQCAHSVPVMLGWVQMNPVMNLMHDGVPSHLAEYTVDKLYASSINNVSWLTYLSNLNMINMLPNRRQDELQEKYSEKANYNKPEVAVRAISDTMSNDVVHGLM